MGNLCSYSFSKHWRWMSFYSFLIAVRALNVRWALKNLFWEYNTVFLAIGMMLYSRPQELTHLAKLKLYPPNSSFIFPCPQPLGTILLPVFVFVFINLTILNIAYKWNHTICVLYLTLKIVRKSTTVFDELGLWVSHNFLVGIFLHSKGIHLQTQ